MTEVSVIIPVRPGSFPSEALAALQRSAFTQSEVEVLIVSGSQPSRQRNTAALQAAGRFLYFLDDDSFVSPEAIARGYAALRDPEIAAVGGPAVTYHGAGFWERCFGEVTASPFGTFTTRSRNIPLGAARRVRGEELILCNLMMRREAFLSARGLNPHLYPNEENELLKRMRQTGHSFLYLPQMTVLRTRRSTVPAFLYQIFRYGWGRGRHILRLFNPRDGVFFVPLLFSTYLAALCFYHPLPVLTPLALYMVLLTAAAAAILKNTRSPAASLLSLLLFPLLHVAYGAGLACGMLSRSKRRPNTPISLERFRLDELPAPGVLRHAA